VGTVASLVSLLESVTSTAALLSTVLRVTVALAARAPAFSTKLAGLTLTLKVGVTTLRATLNSLVVTDVLRLLRVAVAVM
jgi:hypothetical protein